MRKSVLCHMQTKKHRSACTSAQSISTCIVRYLDSMSAVVAISKISRRQLDSVTEQAV